MSKLQHGLPWIMRA